MTSSPSVMEFRRHSEEIVGRFLQTVVIVDDRAYFDEKESSATPTEVVTPGAPSFIEATPQQETSPHSDAELNHSAVEKAPSNVEPSMKEPRKDKEHELNAKKIIDDFAMKSMVCAVIRPKDVEVESLGDKVYPLANSCDIIVFDWVLYEFTDGAKIKEFISEITRTSKEGKRLRLIVVYTGQENLAEIAGQIRARLETDGLRDVKLKDEYTLQSGPVRIAVYAKENVQISSENKDLAARVIPIEQVPDKLISEFTDMTMGLVPNVALESLAALRENTHRILTKFNSDLDGPFLAHRAMLPYPEDANDLLTQLVGAELTAVLEGKEISRVADEFGGTDIIKAWVELNESEMIGTTDRGFAKKFSLKNDPAFIENLCKLLRHGFYYKDLPSEFEPIRKEPHKAKLTSKLSRNKEPEVLEYQFAALTTLRSDYRIKPPTLSPGTILKEVSENNEVAAGEPRRVKYWVCIQPACDCVRVEPRTEFRFLELVVVDGGDFDLVIPDNKFVRVKVAYKSKTIAFSPSGPMSQTVQGVRETNKVCFIADDGSHYSWIAELKFEQAQRIVNKYAAVRSRVGVEESEWLRRWSGG